MLQSHEMFAFDAYVADVRSRRLTRGGDAVAVPARAFDTLVVLLERAGEDVSKSELMDAVWGETHVEENNLNQAISTLRRVFGERRGEQRFIATLPGRGYRFVAPVRRLAAPEATPAPAAGPDETRGATLTLERPAAPDVPARFGRLPLWAQPIALGVFGLVFTTLALALVVWVESATRPSPLRAGARGTVAVLPFRSEGGPGNEHLGPGMAETLIARLGNSGVDIVRATDASDRDPVDAGRAVGAGCVIDGAIRRVGGRIRASLRLVRTSDGATLWAGSFERPDSEIFAVEDLASEQVARALVLTLDDAARARLARRYTDDAVAYDAYLRGRFFWNRRSGDGYGRAIAHFQKAIARDPGYALAYAGIADAEVLIGLGRIDPDARAAAFGRARDAALRAIALDGTLAEAHTSLGAVREVFERDLPEAEREYRLAIALNPAYATSHQWLGELLEAAGRFGEAAAALDRARALDPLSLPVNAALAECLSNMGRYDDAIGVFERTLELEPAFERARYGLGLALEQKREYDQAIAAFRRIRDSDSGNTRAIAALAHVYAAAGQRDQAMRLSEEFERLARSRSERPVTGPAAAPGAGDDAVEPFDRVILYLGLGRRDRAAEWLAKAFERHAGDTLRLTYDPRLAPLRAPSHARAG